uniref:Uncharacterized protein n=1 Tax=Bombyx mori TaxID=7091 RepID=Q86QT4_BOMMO|nr:unknown [Bombyx mori]
MPVSSRIIPQSTPLVFVSPLKLENGWTDLANFGLELPVEVQRGLKVR